MMFWRKILCVAICPNFCRQGCVIVLIVINILSDVQSWLLLWVLIFDGFCGFTWNTVWKYLLLKRSWVNDWNRIMVIYQYDECLIAIPGVRSKHVRYCIWYGGYWIAIFHSGGADRAPVARILLTEYRGVEWWGGYRLYGYGSNGFVVHIVHTGPVIQYVIQMTQAEAQQLNNWNVMGIDGWKG